MGESPGQILDKLLERGIQIKMGVGVVGKTTRAMCLLLTLWGLIVWRLGPDHQLNNPLLAIGIAATLAFGFWVVLTHRFAERNPAQAMLEDAQFLEYRKFEASIKGGADPATLTFQREIKASGLLE